MLKRRWQGILGHGIERVIMLSFMVRLWIEKPELLSVIKIKPSVAGNRGGGNLVNPNSKV